MRVLFATGTPAHYMAPPLLGDEQVVCGPDWPDQCGEDGRWVSLKTPVGEYNLATIASKLAAAQKPDLVVCLVDASWRNLPRGLGAFTCPRVLLVADTHHLQQPLLNMLRYATAEPFTRVILLYDRHHLEVFRSAGMRNVHWFPGLTFPHSDKTVRAARIIPAQRAAQVAFVGQSGPFHPRRKRLIDALKAQKVPLEIKAVPQLEALRHYGRSLIGFNASLNGDLNLRVFEILATGGALLTDRLTVGSGLSHLFGEGSQMITYGDPVELTERAAHALAHPQKTRDIGAAGARWFDEHFSETRRREAFCAMAFDGVPPAVFTLESERSAKPPLFVSVTPLLNAVRCYEILQELHRTVEHVRVAFTASVPEELRTLCKTLPRVTGVADAAGVSADLLIASLDDEAAPLATGERLCVWDARMEDRPRAAARLGNGWTEVREAGAVLFLKSAPVFEYTMAGEAASAPDPRKHVAIYTDDPDKGGVAGYNHELALGLLARGYRVTMVEARSTAPATRRQAEAGIRHAWIEYDTMAEFSRTLTDTGSATQFFQKDRPDLVIFSDCCAISNIGGKHATITAGIPFLTIVHNAGPHLAQRFANCLPVIRHQFLRAREVVTVSSENERLLRTLFGLPGTKGKVIFPSASKHYFESPAENKKQLRKQLGLPHDAVVSLTCARLDPMKGFIFQVCAMEVLRAQCPDSKLVCVWAGEGDAFESLAGEIKKKKLENHIKLVGRQNNVVNWLDAADLFTLTSLSEGMPISIMEAMARGLPVVSTAVGGIGEELGGGGILLPDPNSQPREVALGLVKAWTDLATNAQLRSQFARVAHERALEHFQSEKMVARLVAEVEASISSAAGR